MTDNDTIDNVRTSVLNELDSRAVFPDHIQTYHLLVYEVDQTKEISVATFDEYGKHPPLDPDDTIDILNKDLAKPIFAIKSSQSNTQHHIVVIRMFSMKQFLMNSPIQPMKSINQFCQATNESLGRCLLHSIS